MSHVTKKIVDFGNKVANIEFYRIPNTKLAEALRLIQMALIELNLTEEDLDKDQESMGPLLFKALNKDFNTLKNIFYTGMQCSELELGFFNKCENKMLDEEKGLGLGAEFPLIIAAIGHYLGKSLKKGGDKEKSALEQ